MYLFKKLALKYSALFKHMQLKPVDGSVASVSVKLRTKTARCHLAPIASHTKSGKRANPNNSVVHEPKQLSQKRNCDSFRRILNAERKHRGGRECLSEKPSAVLLCRSRAPRQYFLSNQEAFSALRFSPSATELMHSFPPRNRPLDTKPATFHLAANIVRKPRKPYTTKPLTRA